MKRRLLVTLIMANALSLSTTGLALTGGGSMPSAEGQAVYGCPLWPFLTVKSL